MAEIRLLAAVPVSLSGAPLRRSIALSFLVACSLALASCGARTVTNHAETEGIYVNAGPLTYQVQISRQLNARDVEDGAYLRGLKPAERRLSPQQTWFGVFMRVSNETKRTFTTAGDFSITDSQGTKYAPIVVPASNPFAYRQTLLHAGHIFPTPNSVAGEGVIQGSLVLFKLPFASFENRPLELHIVASPKQEATINLDV